jgi:CheY-like chemotaxis protein
MSKRILVVEDQEDNRQILQDLLTGAGFKVIEAEDGEAGVVAAATHRPVADSSVERGQNSAAVNALALVAKLAGLIVDKREVGKPGEFAEIEKMSIEELDRYIIEKTEKLGDVIKFRKPE